MEESGINSDQFKVLLDQIKKSIFDVQQNKEVMLSKIEELSEKEETQDNKLVVSTENLPLEYWDEGETGPEGEIQEMPSKSGGFKKNTNPVIKKTITEIYKDARKKNTSLSKDFKKSNTMTSSNVLKISKSSFKELKEPNHARKTSIRNLLDDIKGGNYREQTVSKGGSEKSGSQKGFIRMPSKNYSRQDSHKGILRLPSREFKETSFARQRALGNYNISYVSDKMVKSSFKGSPTANETLIKKNRHQSLKKVPVKYSGDEKVKTRRRKTRTKSQISQAADKDAQGVKKKKKKKLDQLITVQTSKSKI
jgi:hypothetical protein